MMQTVYNQHEISSSISNLISNLQQLIDNVKNDTIVAHDNKGDVIVHTILQSVFNFKFENDVNRTFLEIILNHALKAETIGPGSFLVTLESILKKLSLIKQGNHHQKIKVSPCVISSHPTLSDLEKLIFVPLSLKNKVVAELVRKSIQLAGFGGRIIVEKTHSTIPSIELSRGYSFEIGCDWLTNQIVENPRIVCIDGFIEEVSMIHTFLSEASESKEYVIMFTRGMSDDVMHTLKVNYNRGTLKVIPIKVTFDLEGINMMNDLAVVTGSNMISSNKGDLISSVRFNTLSKVEKVVLYHDKIIIQNSSTYNEVVAQIETLKTKREKSDILDIRELYEKRIRCLSPNYVIIRIPDDKDYVANSQLIDYSLRTLKSIVDKGVVVDESTNKLFPTTTSIMSKLYAQKCLDLLVDVGAIVVREKEKEKKEVETN